MQKTHSESFTVQGVECDRFGRMRLDALFVSMQQVGEQHAIRMGVGYEAMMSRSLFFVLARIHVKIARMPSCGDKVVQTTWPGVSNRFFCPRYHVFTLEDGTPLLSAGALWVMLDAANRRIVSPKSLDLAFPDTSDIPAPVDLPVRTPPSVADEAPLQLTRTPVFSEFDINKHVNNTKYIAWLCDALGSEALCGAYISDLTASYEKEICEEAPMNLTLARDGDAFSFLIASGDGVKRFAAGGSLSREV